MAAILAVFAYLLAIALTINSVAFDLWGALLVVPGATLVTVAVIRRLFWGSLRPLVVPMLVGYGLKFAGAIFRYWVAFDAYGGSTDAQRYHEFGRRAAGDFWRGTIGVSQLLPAERGTQFVERVTGTLYAVVGSSKFGGFVMFATVAWWGTACFVKAACTALPHLARQRYAWFCALSPSLLYWPSSIGKEALMMLFLGIASLGIARLFERRDLWRGVPLTFAGLYAAGLIRAHVAALWVAAVIVGTLVTLGGLMRPGRLVSHRSGQAFLVAVMAGLSVMTFLALGRTAVDLIKPVDEEQSFRTSVEEVLRETTRRSDQGGSNFTPPPVEGLQTWPFAIVRTLTRPLLTESRGVFQLMTAAEMTLILSIAAVSWRRIAAAPLWVLRSPYIAVAISVVVAGGLAYSSFANLGILARQKTLLMPFMLLLLCLPPHPRRVLMPAWSTPMTVEFGRRPSLEQSRMR